MKYRLTDHTADIGIHVFGNDLKDLFENAAMSLYDMMTEVERVTGVDTQEIQVTGEDFPDLMVNWLREMLFFWTGKEQLVKAVKIIYLSDHELTASVKTEAYTPERHVIRHEIKAVTYHQIQVYENNKGWEAEIIFDV
jgi:SHS2 domain-containing protein